MVVDVDRPEVRWPMVVRATETLPSSALVDVTAVGQRVGTTVTVNGYTQSASADVMILAAEPALDGKTVVWTLGLPPEVARYLRKQGTATLSPMVLHMLAGAVVGWWVTQAEVVRDTRTCVVKQCPQPARVAVSASDRDNDGWLGAYTCDEHCLDTIDAILGRSRFNHVNVSRPKWLKEPSWPT